MKKLLLLLLALTALSLGACRARPQAPQPEAVSMVQYATEEPGSLPAVLDIIYKDITMEGLKDADSTSLTDLFHMEPGWVDSFAARYSNGRYGVADVVILKAKPDRSEDITTALELRRSDRIAEFENYDIHDSLNIAKDAEIFTRGDYVIMLMLADTEAAHTVILEQIPG